MFNFFVFQSIPTLETERLRLRPLSKDDAPGVFAILGDADVAHGAGVTPLTTIEQANTAIDGYHRNYQNKRSIRWAIVRKDGNTLIGMGSFQRFDIHSRRAEIAYELGKPYWRQGYATEAVSALLHIAFKTMNLHRVEAVVEPGNIASQGLLEKIGFQAEGRLRERFLQDGTFHDDLFFGLLAHEWNHTPL
jgi:ribosomal-protein-alanine N-acetyltransferase